MLYDKSHHTQIEYTKRLSIKRILINAYNIYTLYYTSFYFTHRLFPHTYGLVDG